MKKTVKIKFIGFWDGFNPEENVFSEVLKRHYNVVVSDNPDYVFCSVLGIPYEECKYDGIRIHFNGENYTPDFNIHDYGISFNHLQFSDRHLEYPLYLINQSIELANKKHLNIHEKILEEKLGFCNFIYGVSREYRNQALEKFTTYKKVLSPGTGSNNMPNHPLVTTLDQKLSFQRKTKFTIAFDSTQHPGFVTEKILHGFASQTIPIYFGAPDIGIHFNKKSFIDVADYDNDLDKVLEKIIEIDQDDDLYLSILREPVFNDEKYVEKKQKQFEDFLVNIFNQDFENVYRRSRIAAPQFHNERLKNFSSVYKGSFFSKIKLNLSRLIRN